MNKYEIVIESTGDANEELRTRFGLYKDYIQNIVYLSEDKEIKADLDWKNFTPKQYFTLVKRNAGKIRTAFANFEEFKRVIEPILKEGKDAIIVTISTAISGTYNNFKLYADELLESYPERKIGVVDSLKYSSAISLLAFYMAQNRDKGMSLEDNINFANEFRYRIHESGPMDDLSFLAKNGRISATKAFFGGLVGVNPIADFNHQGMSAPLGTVKGEKLANEVALKYLLKTATDLENQIVIITHSDRLARANEFKNQLLKATKVKDVIITSVGQSCGPNIGPGLCCYFYVGAPLTEDRKVELEAFNEAQK